jgi:3-hydroxyacyl-[acyl-carrier-protein] dehydratase
MPGVVQIEAAAQLLSFFVKQVYEEQGFVGFGGIDRAKFRAAIEPGCRLYLLGHVVEARPGRKYVCDVQGVVSQTLAFEATISGMKV